MLTMWRDDLDRNTNPLRFMLYVSRPYVWYAAGSLLAVATGALLNVYSSYVFRGVVNASTSLVAGGSTEALWRAGMWYIAISFASVAAWRTSGFVGMHWSTGIRATARYALSSYITLHSHDYFSNRFAGSLSSKISNAAGSTKSIAELILWNFTGFLVTMVASLVITTQTNPTLGIIFLAWVAVITPMNVYFARRRVTLSEAAQKAETELGGATVDILTNMSAVHEYANRSLELERLKGLVVHRRVTGLRNWRYGESVLTLNGLIQVGFVACLLITTIRLVGAGILMPGDIALVLIIIVYVEDRLTFIGNQINNFAESWGQVKESLEDILRPHDVAERAKPTPLVVSEGSITFADVNFTYGNTQVFTNFTLTIPAGQKVGLVGRSGAGKSTLVKLLLRHYDLSEGSITIDGVNIADVQKEEFRRHVAVVPQEPSLFHRTIRENIAYGKPEATLSEVEAAAKLAEAHEFIVQLPDGYDSLVGERGVKLSGGQRQRIVIARALLKNAPILLLDEATSALDSESEVAVQKALLNLMQDRTVIAIAHRLSTLRAMDRIIVMDQGRIIEDGTHEELLEKGGLYASLWSHQARGFLEE